MKSSWLAIVIGLLIVTCLGSTLGAVVQQQPKPESTPCAGGEIPCPAQPAAPVSAAAPAEKTVLHILAEFSQPLNVKKLKPGQKIKAQVTQDVLWHGKIIVPVESKLEGHVTEVKRRTSDDPESRLGFVFDKVSLPHHKEIDFQGIVQALSAPAPRRSKVDEPDQMLPPSSMTVQNNGAPMGSTSPHGSTGSMSNKTMVLPTIPEGAPLYVDGTPGSNAGNSVGGDIRHNGTLRGGGSKPMSVGMPRGVFGIKGLSLTTGPSSETPGPVVVSTVNDVKLEDGVQVLLKVTDPIVR